MVYRYAIKTETEFALGELLHILHKIEKSHIYNQFQENCFVMIEKKDKTAVHLKILLMICNNRIDYFEKLEINLIGIIVSCIAHHADDNRPNVIEDGLELLTEVTKSTTRDISVE